MVVTGCYWTRSWSDFPFNHILILHWNGVVIRKLHGLLPLLWPKCATVLLLTWSHPWLVEVVVNDWRKFEANSFLCRVAWFWCTGIFKIVKRTYFVSEALLSSSDLGHYWWLLHWLLRTFEKQRRKNNNSFTFSRLWNMVKGK